MRLFRPRCDPHPGALAILLFALLGVLTPCARAAPPADAGSDPPLPLFEVDLGAPGAGRQLFLLDLDVISVRPGGRARVLGWPGTEEALRNAGLPVRRLTGDYGGDLARSRGVIPLEPRGAEVTAGLWDIPPFGSGSLAGFWTFDEIAALLDSLAASDSLGLVTGPDTLGYSIQGRPILALGVTNLAQPLGTRPEVLITALHHAREPAGMQSVLYFLVRLLEGYGTDPELTYLADSREIWFVPVVNPDGYVRNENTWVDSGTYGMWRKNLRNNDVNPQVTSQDGVDLNRNYGYQWGYDGLGSSGTPSSPTYRGTGPFSEPETQVMRDFVNAHQFRVANNFHTYWEITLYPWGYINSGTPDDEAFARLGDALTDQSHYSYGVGPEILYAVNGEANDWMYGDVSEKPKVFAFTTEVGTQDDGFWPPPSRILPLALSQQDGLRALCYGAGIFLAPEGLTVDSGDGTLAPGSVEPVRLAVRHIGVTGTTAGGIEMEIVSGDPELTVSAAPVRFPDLGPGGIALPEPGDHFLFQAAPSLVNGTLVPLYLSLADGGGYVGRDTLAFRVGHPTLVFEDTGDDGLLNWIAGSPWAVETVDGDPVFSDSPGGDYESYLDTSLTLDHGLDLSGAVHAVLRFRTQWNIEIGFDFARVEVSTNGGGTWTALPGTGTRPGHGNTGQYSGGTQPLDVPGYDGNQRFWAEEEVDLSAYAGLNDLRLRFRMSADGSVAQDGWLVDDIRVLAYAPYAVLAALDPAPPMAPTLGAMPNPFGSRTRISYALEQPSRMRLSIYDIEGREIRVLSEGYAAAGEKELDWDGRNGAGQRVSAGTYFLRLDHPGGSASTKLLVLR